MSIFNYSISINSMSVSLVLLSIILLLIFHKIKDKKTTIEDLFITGFSAASIPTGFTLIYCAYDPLKINLLANVTMQIALVGAGVIFISYKTIKDRI